LACVLGSIVGAVALGILTSSIALAYPPASLSGSEISGCSKVALNSNCVYTYQFLSGTGVLASGASVTFSVSGVLGASVSPAGQTAGSNGEASTTFSPGTSTCGTGTITATASSPVTVGTSVATATATATATVSTSVFVTCPLPGTGTGTGTAPPLPFTGTDPPGPNAWLYVIFGIATLVVITGTVMLRRTRQSTV
jgi:hypothetical protein